MVEVLLDAAKVAAEPLERRVGGMTAWQRVPGSRERPRRRLDTAAPEEAKRSGKISYTIAEGCHPGPSAPGAITKSSASGRSWRASPLPLTQAYPSGPPESSQR